MTWFGSCREVGEHGRLAVAEAGFAFRRKISAMVRAGPGFEFGVGVDERPAEPVGEEPADGGLAGAAVADQEDAGQGR